MSVRLLGSAARVIKGLLLFDKETRKRLKVGQYKFGKVLISAAHREIKFGKKTGRVYLIRVSRTRRRRHRASAPGETHAEITGGLRRSIGFQVRGSLESEFGYGVGQGDSAPVQAASLEFGNRRFNIKPRPTLFNALNAEQGRVIVILESELNRDRST